MPCGNYLQSGHVFSFSSNHCWVFSKMCTIRWLLPNVAHSTTRGRPRIVKKRGTSYSSNQSVHQILVLCCLCMNHSEILHNQNCMSSSIYICIQEHNGIIGSSDSPLGPTLQKRTCWNYMQSCVNRMSQNSAQGAHVLPSACAVLTCVFDCMCHFSTEHE